MQTKKGGGQYRQAIAITLDSKKKAKAKKAHEKTESKTYEKKEKN